MFPPGKSNGVGGQDFFSHTAPEEQLKYGGLEEDEHDLPGLQGLVSQTFSVDGTLRSLCVWDVSVFSVYH